MGLAWVIMAPEGDRPLILQKAGGLEGIFSYAAFAPSRNIDVAPRSMRSTPRRRR
jgi:serine-type D-Ala-D-Ala carboxypeptidase/endopeptidase